MLLLVIVLLIVATVIHPSLACFTCFLITICIIGLLL